MQTHLADRRMTWLVAGTMLGMAISYYCPGEPAYADTAASSDSFSMVTASTNVGQTEAVFVLDMVAGRIVGAAYNWNTGAFNQYYARDVAADFGLRNKGKYVMVSGWANVRQVGPLPPATSAIWVGELTTGKCNMYTFVYENAPLQINNTELILTGQFPWKAQN